MDASEAQSALDSISKARRSAAEVSKAPPGYYALLGLAYALLVVSASFEGGWIWAFQGLTWAVLIASVFWYSRAVTTWGWGNIFGKGAFWFWLMMVVGVGALVSSFLVSELWFSIVVGAVTVVVWAVLGPVWDRAYRAQLEAKE